MPRWAWPLAILLIAAGAAAGYFTVPHYQPPQEAGEARLRDRAAAYYQSSRRFDMAGMARLYTPAYQLGKDGKLGKIVEANRLQRSRTSADKLGEYEAMARGIEPAQIDTVIEGEWAVTSGTAALPADGENAGKRMPLETIVWVRSAGDWWVYQLQNDELLHYGNPPDFARKVLAKDSFKPAEVAADPPAAEVPAPDSGAGGGS